MLYAQNLELALVGAEVEGVLETAEGLAKERDIAWYWDKLLGTEES